METPGAGPAHHHPAGPTARSATNSTIVLGGRFVVAAGAVSMPLVGSGDAVVNAGHVAVHRFLDGRISPRVSLSSGRRCSALRRSFSRSWAHLFVVIIIEGQGEPTGRRVRLPAAGRRGNRK